MSTLFEAMVNGWWQGIVLTLLVWLALRDLRRVSASTKVAIWQLTLLVVVFLPALQRVSLPLWQPMWQPMWQTGEEAQPLVNSVPASVSALRVPAAKVQAVRESLQPVIELPRTGAEAILILSLALGFIQILRLACGYWSVRRLKRSGMPTELSLPVAMTRPVQVLVSDRVGMPMAVGYCKPAILLPQAMLAGLTREEARYVLLHEAAHLLRRDDWMALGERVLRAIFCFQPAVHWIGRQIEREREIACDDWVVVQSGGAKGYATSLARVAELGSKSTSMGRVPLLATGVGRPKEIFARLESLFDRTRNRMPQVSGTLVMAAGLVLLFAVSQGSGFSHLFGLENYSNTWRESDGTRSREFKIRGDVQFTANDQDVESMSPGAKLQLAQSEGWSERVLEFNADEHGTIERRYFVDGIARPWGAEAQRYLAKVLPQWARERGEKIPERLARMVQQSGVTGTLEELRTIRRSDVKRGYLEELFSQVTLDDGQLERALKVAREMGSDGDKRHFLESVAGKYADRGLDTQALSFIDGVQSDGDRQVLLGRWLERGLEGEGRLARFARSVEQLHSDSSKADLLIQAAREAKGRLPEAFFSAASTIHSMNDREKVLSAALQTHVADPGTAAQVLRLAVALTADGAKSRVILEFAQQLPRQLHRDVHGDSEALREVSRVLRSMHADGELRRCLEALLEADGSTVETLREVLARALAIHADGDKAHVLMEAVPWLKEEETARRAFFAAVASMHSSGDQQRVLKTVLTRAKLDVETLREVSRSASQIMSEKERREVLREVEGRR